MMSWKYLPVFPPTLHHNHLPLSQHILCFCHTGQKTTRSTPKPQCSNAAPCLYALFPLKRIHFLPSNHSNLPPCRTPNPSYKPFLFWKIKLQCLLSATLSGDKILLCIQSQQTNSVSFLCVFKVYFSHIYYGTYHIILKTLYLPSILSRWWTLWWPQGGRGWSGNKT